MNTWRRFKESYFLYGFLRDPVAVGSFGVLAVLMLAAFACASHCPPQPLRSDDHRYHGRKNPAGLERRRRQAISARHRRPGPRYPLHHALRHAGFHHHRLWCNVAPGEPSASSSVSPPATAAGVSTLFSCARPMCSSLSPPTWWPFFLAPFSRRPSACPATKPSPFPSSSLSSVWPNGRSMPAPCAPPFWLRRRKSTWRRPRSLGLGRAASCGATSSPTPSLPCWLSPPCRSRVAS